MIQLHVEKPFILKSLEGILFQICCFQKSGVDNIKKAIRRLQEEQQTVSNEMENEMSKKEDQWNTGYLRLLFERQKNISKDINRFTEGLINLYEGEMAKWVERDESPTLSKAIKDDIADEVEKFKEMFNLGLTTSTEIEIDGSLFSNLSTKLTEQCPLLFEIIESLLLVSSDGHTQTGRRVHSASHAMAILCSLSSQKLTNDFKILFTLLCISYGAGMRFVELLNHVGLTVSWKKVMQVLDQRMIKMKEKIKKLTPTDIAIILLMDNINI